MNDHIPRRPIPDLDSVGSAIEDKVKWDFERLVQRVEEELVGGTAPGEIERELAWPQPTLANASDPEHPERELGVIFNGVEFVEDGGKVKKMIIRGCMLRGSSFGSSDFDKPPRNFPTGESSWTCQTAKEEEQHLHDHETVKSDEKSSEDERRAGHVIYSSSSSSSAWA